MIINWLTLFQFLLMVLSLLLGCYLLSLRRAYALAGYFLVLAMHNSIRLAVNMDIVDKSFDITHGFRFLYAVLVFFSVQEILYQRLPHRAVFLLHLIPTVLAMALPFVAPVTANDLGVLVAVVQVLYIVACFRLILQANTVINETRSSGSADTVTWLLRAMTIYSVMMVFEISRYFIGLMMPTHFYELSHLLFVALTCLFLTILVYQGLRNPLLLPAINDEERALGRHLNSRNSRCLSAGDMALQQQLSAFMREHKPHLNAQLSLKELAAGLGISARALSELINDVYRCNFSEFINRERVSEAQILMAHPHSGGHSLLDIGLAAGFNSKTSFNVMFKRFTGQTPSAYRKSLLETGRPVVDSA